jgi:hypothetical protein
VCQMGLQVEVRGLNKATVTNPAFFIVSDSALFAFLKGPSNKSEAEQAPSYPGCATVPPGALLFSDG